MKIFNCLHVKKKNTCRRSNVFNLRERKKNPTGKSRVNYKNQCNGSFTSVLDVVLLRGNSATTTLSALSRLSISNMLFSKAANISTIEIDNTHTHTNNKLVLCKKKKNIFKNIKQNKTLLLLSLDESCKSYEWLVV